MEYALSKTRELRESYRRVYVPDKGKTFNTNLMFTLELGLMLDCAETIALSAIERQESRGAHTRTDMPDRDDDNWLKHILVERRTTVRSWTTSRWSSPNGNRRCGPTRPAQWPRRATSRSHPNRGTNAWK